MLPMQEGNCIAYPAPKKPFAALIQTDLNLELVEERIQSKIISEAPLLEQIPNYLLNLGGKRIRPTLVLLCYKAFSLEPLPASVIDIAAGIELVHMSTLLHDDIIDHAPLRRHRTSPLAKFGESSTLLAGDFLLVRAFALCANLDAFIIERTEKACVELTEGEILETPLFLKQHDLDSALNIAEKKTASLFSLAAEAATYLSTAPQTCVSQMAEFGRYLGTAFQIVDDILDISSNEKSSGKQRGTDLRESKPSIVNTLWLQAGSLLSKQLLKEPQQREGNFLDQAISEITKSSVLDQAAELAASYIQQAGDALEKARQHSSRPVNDRAFQDLENLAEASLTRLK